MSRTPRQIACLLALSFYSIVSSAHPRPQGELLRTLQEMERDFRSEVSLDGPWIERIHSNPALLTTAFTEAHADDSLIFRFLRHCEDSSSLPLHYRCRMLLRQWSETDALPSTDSSLIEYVLIHFPEAFEEIFMNAPVVQNISFLLLAFEQGEDAIAHTLFERYFDAQTLAQYLLNNCFAHSRAPWNFLLQLGYSFSNEDLHTVVSCTDSNLPLSILLQGSGFEIDSFVNGRTALQEAAERCNPQAVRSLLIKGASSTLQTENTSETAETLLQRSAEHTSENCQYTLRLLREGPDVAPPVQTEFVVDENGRIIGIRTRRTRTIPASQ